MISRLSSNTKILDYNTGFECSRMKAQCTGTKKGMLERQREGQAFPTGAGGLRHAGGSGLVVEG